MTECKLFRLAVLQTSTERNSWEGYGYAVMSAGPALFGATVPLGVKSGKVHNQSEVPQGKILNMPCQYRQRTRDLTAPRSRPAAWYMNLAVCLWLASCTAPSAESGATPRLPTDAEVEQYNATVSAEERIVCRDEVPVGSYIPQRTCRLVRDMQEISRFQREQLRNVLR